MQKVNSKKTVVPNSSKNENIRIILVAVVIQLVAYLITSLVCFAADIKRDILVIFSLIAFSIGSFTASFYTGRKKRKKGLINGVLFTLPANTVLIASSLIANNFSCDYFMLITASVLIVSSALGGIISVNVRKKSKIKR